MDFVLKILELVFVGATAIIGLGTVVFIGYQTSRHFRFQRSTHFIERFNSAEMIELRFEVDFFLADNPNWEKILKRYLANELTDNNLKRNILKTLRFTNFFQELATAHKHKTLHEDYIWDVFGGAICMYWENLLPFIESYRKARLRKTLFQDFENVYHYMKKYES